jgi:glycosyltransferase involved in cell wall biosynthesis
LVVCYVGGFTRGRVILPLIEVVKEDPSLGLVLVGDGPQAPSLLAAAEGVDRIAYVGKRVPADQVVNVMRAADVVYYGLRSDFPNNHFSSPNALYSALAAGRPLLTTNVGEIAQVVRAEECGVILEAPTAEAIGAGLAELRAPGVRATMSRNARSAAESKYNWPAAEAELLNLYRNLWGEV